MVPTGYGSNSCVRCGFSVMARVDIMKYKSRRTTSHPAKHSNNLESNHGAQATAVGATLPYGERIFHYLWTLAAIIGLISYFTMASDLGNTPVRQYMHNRGNPGQTRQIFYVRYIYWFLAWPQVITANLLLSGVSWATIYFAVALQEIWVVSWLSGALVSTSYKWGYFTFGLFAYLAVAYILLSWGVDHAKHILTGKGYGLLAGALVVVWLIYPIAWGLSEGSNRLSITGEMIFYGILDLIAIPIYGTLFLIYSTRLNPDLFYFTQVGRVSGGHTNGAVNPNV
ncbi:hypothetical protein BKA65DRAFT_488037 [Rhexocercosporidium sp. MPI-PUGE-AT-0058]|nr:hypothetical protein BKA65DRAFT_488037 [Rhexocercosporidium sp. MPI-PUGE-AT-0058]